MFVFVVEYGWHLCGCYGVAVSEPGACFSNVPRIFRARKAICQTAIRMFWIADLLTCFNVRKTKWITKLDGLEIRGCEDIKGDVAPEIGP